MKTANTTITWIGKIGLFVLLMTMWGCIREDHNPEDCSASCLLYLGITDIAYGEDITLSGEVTDATLFFFDSDDQLIRSVTLDAKQIADREPIAIEVPYNSNIKVSAWGNLSSHFTVPQAMQSAAFSAAAMTLTSDDSGYSDCPSDLFFGIREILYTGQQTYTETVYITQKNARMHITVRGLPNTEDPEDYYFRICSPYNGYTFHGEPVRYASEHRQTGTFGEQGDLTTPEAFYLIHAADGDITSENCTYVHLYKTAGTRASWQDDLLIASTESDEDGVLIAPQAGKTTNVLLNLNGTASVDIRVEVTPWDEIYQWEIL